MADERSSARVARPSLFHRRPARPFALSIDSRPTDFIVALATLAKAANELHTGASDECSGSTLRVRRIGPCPRVYHFGIRGRRHSPLFFATNDTLARERELGCRWKSKQSSIHLLAEIQEHQLLVVLVIEGEKKKKKGISETQSGTWIYRRLHPNHQHLSRGGIMGSCQ